MSMSGTLDLAPALELLTVRERIVVEARLKGMSMAACAAAAGIPLDDVRSLLEGKHIQAALKLGTDICEDHSRITRERLSQMLLNAYDHADDATEMVLAVRELAKLHGLNAPTQVRVDHTVRLKAVRTEAELRQLPLEELERLADMRGQDVLEDEFIPVKTAERV